ncbi:MAG: FkbM family methyltransferase [Dysgonomonas sp.]
MNFKILRYTFWMFYRYGIGGRTIKSAFNISFSTKKLIKVSLPNFSKPIYLRKGSSDLDVFYEILLYSKYGNKIDKDIDPKIIFDCGANIGLTAICFKRKYPKARIIAIEPEANNYELLLKNTEGYDDIFCLNVGVWNKSTWLEVNNVNATNWGFSFHETEEKTEGSIEAKSIKDMMSEFSVDYIDILKIDIEGAEVDLFDSNYKYWLDRTSLIIIELHDRKGLRCGKKLFERLGEYDFLVEIEGENLICRIMH